MKKYEGKRDVTKIYSIRNDVSSWDQLLQNKNRPPTHQRVWKPSLPTPNVSDYTYQRHFFDNFAKENHFNPLVAEEWYKLDRSSIPKSGQGILRYYSDSLINALVSVYPEVPFELHKFKYLPSFWTKRENRRIFFDEFAKSRTFDPLIASNWYHFISDDFTKSKGGHGVLSHYEGSFSQALLDIYPFIGLEALKFKFIQTKYFMDKNNRRHLLDQYAASRNFDPLIASNWYNVNYSDIIAIKGGQAILDKYNDSLVECLQDLYPTVNLDVDRFKYPTRYWEDKDNQKAFLDQFAQRAGFDPLIINDWYQVTSAEVCKTKRGSSLINKYGGLMRALESIYGHKLDPFNYPSVPSKFWKEKSNRKRFFDQVANKMGFSHNNVKEWYYLSSRDILKFRGGVTILDKYYDGSYKKALLDIYPDIGLDPALLRGNKKEKLAQ